MEFLGIHIPGTARREVAAPVETEQQRVQRITAEQLAERNRSNRTQSGAGVGRIQMVNAPSSEGTGKSPATLAAEQGTLPARDNTQDRPPL